MLIKTHSGSLYEIDSDNKKIRRLSNSEDRNPTDRQGKDQEWKEFTSMSEVRLGFGILITWPKSTTPLFHDTPPSYSPSTLTSPVVEIEDD